MRFPDFNKYRLVCLQLKSIIVYKTKIHVALKICAAIYILLKS